MTVTRQKRDAEEVSYYMDFANLLTDISASESLSSVVGISSSPSGLTIGEGQINGTKVEFQVSGGTANTLYKIEVLCLTSTSQKIEDEGLLEVYN